MTESATNAPWTLRRRVTGMCLLLGIVLTFLAAGAATTAVANRGQLDALLDEIGPMRTASNVLATDLVSQETAVRGFVLNGTEADLSPYPVAVADAEVQTAAIAANPAATDEVRARLAEVTSLAARWRAQVGDPAIAAMKANDRDTATKLIDDSARQLFDEIRAAVLRLQDTMQTIRDVAVANIKDTSSTLLFVLIVAAVMVIAAAVTLLVAMQRAVIGPVTYLAAQVRSVSRGNYGQEITTDGPPELQNLAYDVDVMRRQIAADLAEVVAARRQIEQANAALEQQAAELVRSNRDLEQFAYVASHDLQEPLRKVASFCQLLQRRYQGQLDERADQYIAFAVNGAQRMQRLINDLLAFSRIGRNTAGFVELDLDRVVADAVDQVDSAAEGAHVTWSDLPVVRGEEALLATLFGNLIGNAIKFRQPDVAPEIRISARPVGTDWEITCADNGIGIEREYADKVFVIFQRLHPRDAYPGTGIGLAVAKKIVEYHGGEIWIDTAQKSGTTIRFTLPTVDQKIAALPDAPPAGILAALTKEPVA